MREDNGKNPTSRVVGQRRRDPQVTFGAARGQVSVGTQIPVPMLLPVRIPSRAALAPEFIHSEALAYFMGCVGREALLGREDARDLAADVVAAVLPRLEHLEAPLRYVLTMCRHRLIHFLKRKRARVQRVVADGSIPAVADPDPSMDVGLGDLELRQLVHIRSHMRETDTLTRQIIQLRSETDLTFSEIAALVHRRPASIRMRVMRFARRVRASWAERERATWPRA